MLGEPFVLTCNVYSANEQHVAVLVIKILPENVLERNVPKEDESIL